MATNNHQPQTIFPSDMSKLAAYSAVAYVQSLGCAPNQADGMSISEFLASVGWKITDRPEDASVVIVLTCGFTQETENSNIARLHEIGTALAQGSRLFVGGCLPAIAGSRLKNLPPHTSLFNPRNLDNFKARFRPSTSTKDLGCIRLSKQTPMRIVRISTGCMSKCSFCAIPMATGKTLSRPIADIISEIDAALDEGIDSFRLTSEDVSAYGLDIESSFVELVQMLLSKAEVKKLVLDTLNPKWLRKLLPETISVLSDVRVDKRLYIPIQSGSDTILRRMRRGYTTQDVRRILDSLNAHIPSVQISTDFLVGFPGETEADFISTRTLLTEYPFKFIEVFRYTPRSGTPAAEFADKVPNSIGDLRARLLLSDFLEVEFDRAGANNATRVLSFLENDELLPINTNVSAGDDDNFNCPNSVSKGE